MKMLKEYFELENKIHEYFGYKEDWTVIPLDDKTDHHWMLMERPAGAGSCVYDSEPLTIKTVSSGKICSGVIYTNRFLPKWVYRTDDYTMVCVDTQCDGNKFLMIFDNKLECHDGVLKQIYLEKWTM